MNDGYEFCGPVAFRSCGTCGASKPLSAFYQQAGRLYGRASRCASCAREAQADAVRNPETARRASRVYAQRHKGSRWFRDVKSRAKARGIEFNLTMEDFDVPSHCPVLGIPLARVQGMKVNSTPTVDQVDPHGGYMKGNVRVISWRANKIKSDATLEELEALVAYMRAHMPQK